MFRLGNDQNNIMLNNLIERGVVEIIDPDIIGLPNGIIEFREGDQFTVIQDTDGRYERIWTSAEAYKREMAKAALVKKG